LVGHADVVVAYMANRSQFVLIVNLDGLHNNDAILGVYEFNVMKTDG
jgi:hypothetical protein